MCWRLISRERSTWLPSSSSINGPSANWRNAVQRNWRRNQHKTSKPDMKCSLVEKREGLLKRYRVLALLWGIGLLIYVVSCFIIHAHPQPFPFDLAVTQALTPLQDVRWANTLIQIPGIMNDTLEDIIITSVLFVALLLIGEIRRRRGKSAI